MASKKTKKWDRTTNSSFVPRIGKDEMNLCELPIAKLGRRDKREIIEFTGETVKNGQTLIQEWIVRGAAGLGLPTEFAERVLVALISIAAEDRFASRQTAFSVYRVLKLMELNPNGEHYADVRQALERLHGVTITGKNTWWDNDKKKYRTIRKGFGLIDNYWLKCLADDDDEETEGSGGYVIWNQWLWDSFQAGYIKNIDTSFYYGLESILARRLYRFLDKRMHYQDTYQIDIFALAARLGMAAYRYPSKVKEKLQPAFDELITRGFLASADVFRVGKFTRVGFRKTGAESTVYRSLFEIPGPPENVQGAETAPEAPATPHETLYTLYGTPDALQEVWAGILDDFQRSNPASYDMFYGSALLRIEDGTATIAAKAPNHDWIANRMRRQLVTALTIASDEQVTKIHLVGLEGTN